MPAPAWDAHASGRAAPGQSGSQGDEITTPALKLDAAARNRSTSARADQIEAMREAIIKNARNRLQIERAEDNGRFIYRILDPDTGETMRQWPPERYLELLEYLNEKRGGLLDRTV